MWFQATKRPLKSGLFVAQGKKRLLLLFFWLLLRCRRCNWGGGGGCRSGRCCGCISWCSSGSGRSGRRCSHGSWRSSRRFFFFATGSESGGGHQGGQQDVFVHVRVGKGCENSRPPENRAQATSEKLMHVLYSGLVNSIYPETIFEPKPRLYVAPGYRLAAQWLLTIPLLLDEKRVESLQAQHRSGKSRGGARPHLVNLQPNRRAQTRIGTAYRHAAHGVQPSHGPFGRPHARGHVIG